MSLPRDLKVEIPGHGVDKINAAYSLRRAAPDDADGQAADRPLDQPRHQRRLPRLPEGDRRDRLHLHRRRPPLLQRHRRVRLHQHPRRLPADVRRQARSSTSATATRTPTSSAASASRTCCATPSSRSASAALVDDRDKLLEIFGKYTTSDGALKDRARAAAAAQAGGLLGRPADPPRQVRGRGRTSPAMSRRRATSPPATRPSRSSRSSSSASRRRKGPRGALKPKGKRKRSGSPSDDGGLEKDTQFGKEQAISGDRAGRRRQAPRLLPDGPRRRLPVTSARRASTRSSTPDDKRRKSYRMVLEVAERRRVLRHPGDDAGRTRRSSTARPRSARSSGRKFELHYEGDRLRLVAWRTAEGRLLGLEHAAADAERASR